MADRDAGRRRIDRGRALRVAAAITLLAGCGVSGPGDAAPEPATTVAGPSVPPIPRCTAGSPGDVCVLFLGDSLAAGTPLTDDDRWWILLRHDLERALPGRRVVVDSVAVPGSGIHDLEATVRDTAGLSTWDVAVVSEGVNDESTVRLAAWRTRYDAALSAIEAAGPTVVIVTPPPTLEEGEFRTRYGPIAVAQREVAGTARPVVDIWAAWTAEGEAVASEYYADVIHQNARGQRRMADVALDVVVRALAERAAGRAAGEAPVGSG